MCGYMCIIVMGVVIGYTRRCDLVPFYKCGKVLSH